MKLYYSIIVSCSFGQVNHSFMCEMVPFKQKFLMRTVPGDTCIFKEATQMFVSTERSCVKHGKCCDA